MIPSPKQPSFQKNRHASLVTSSKIQGDTGYVSPETDGTDITPDGPVSHFRYQDNPLEKTPKLCPGDKIQLVLNGVLCNGQLEDLF